MVHIGASSPSSQVTATAAPSTQANVRLCTTLKTPVPLDRRLRGCTVASQIPASNALDSCKTPCPLPTHNPSDTQTPCKHHRASPLLTFKEVDKMHGMTSTFTASRHRLSFHMQTLTCRLCSYGRWPQQAGHSESQGLKACRIQTTDMTRKSTYGLQIACRCTAMLRFTSCCCLVRTGGTD